MFVQQIPYQSVRAPADPPLVAAADARARRMLLIVAAFARPFLRQEAAAAAAARRERARSSSCSITRPAWATAITGSARGTPRSSAIRSLGAQRRRRSCCSAATPKRACARRPTAAGSKPRSTRAKVDADATRYGPALKLAESILSRSQARRARSGPHQRLPEGRLDRRGRRALPRGLRRDAGVGGDARREQHRRAVGHVRARDVLGPGARHGHGRHREQGQRRRSPTCR